MRLSENFALQEFLRSQTAQRQGGEMLSKQMNPDHNIVENLQYLVTKALQPLRTLLRTPFQITSGYRCQELNTRIGGSSNSQHCFGQAADVVMFDNFLNEPNPVFERIKKIIDHKILKKIGRLPRTHANANFYLFATACFFINETDVDQVIHEYGQPGQPAWVHISSSPKRNKREIVIIPKPQDFAHNRLSLEEALMMGCD